MISGEICWHVHLARGTWFSLPSSLCFHYLVSGELKGAVVETSAVPHYQLRVILEKVSLLLLEFK